MFGFRIRLPFFVAKISCQENKEMRLIIGAIVGGIVMFCWGAFSHMVLPVAEMGLKVLPPASETAMVSAMKTNIPDAGMYFIPGLENMKHATEAEQEAWAKKYEEGPTAMIIYHAVGRPVFAPRQMLVELGSNIFAALIVGIIFMWSVASFSKRVIIAVLIGLTGWASIAISYWNWYRFPKEFILAEGFDQVVGWLLSGLVLAFIIKPKS
jgi:hypothetical protein